MSSNAESDAGDVIEDLAALPAQMWRGGWKQSAELAQRGKQAARSHFVDAVGDAQDKIVNSAANAQARIRSTGGDLRRASDTIRSWRRRSRSEQEFASA